MGRGGQGPAVNLLCIAIYFEGGRAHFFCGLEFSLVGVIRGLFALLAESVDWTGKWTGFKVVRRLKLLGT